MADDGGEDVKIYASQSDDLKECIGKVVQDSVTPSLQGGLITLYKQTTVFDHETGDYVSRETKPVMKLRMEYVNQHYNAL